MRNRCLPRTIALLPLAAVLAAPLEAHAGDDGKLLVFGIKVSAGGRYDNVRMCVGSAAGVKGGPAMDIALYAEFGLKADTSLVVTLPVMRPILFGAAFRMLQFEPEVALAFRQDAGGTLDLIVGPTVGLSFHYGPDYTSSRSGPGRGPSFFAMGPRIGVTLGLDFKRPDEKFNFQLGLHPYATTLFSAGDPEEHRGVVLGGTLDGVFRFHAGT
jgi:hypothetical protein